MHSVKIEWSQRSHIRADLTKQERANMKLIMSERWALVESGTNKRDIKICPWRSLSRVINNSLIRSTSTIPQKTTTEVSWTSDLISESTGADLPSLSCKNLASPVSDNGLLGAESSSPETVFDPSPFVNVDFCSSVALIPPLWMVKC